MPRYFFHLRCAEKDVPDAIGADLLIQTKPGKPRERPLVT
jgi:hypothetical protein